MNAHPHISDASRATAGIAAHIDEFIALRRDLHRHPELAFKEERTSGIVAARLESWGYEVHRGIAGYGLVGVLCRGEGPSLALRADMDALPIDEQTGLAYASANPGVMHACGHDGHTTILLAAARYLAEHGRFSGTLNLIFQPAEEIGAGAKRMIAEGLFDRFPSDAVFGLHNWPGFDAGRLAFVDGPAMASVDQAIVTVIGKGGHGAEPHNTIDPVLVSAHVITALQSVVSRNVDPREMAVVTVGSIHGGSASNVIPESVELKLTMRAFRPHVREALRQGIPGLIQAQAKSFGAQANVDYRLGFPSVVNHPAETALARKAALDSSGLDSIDDTFQPRTASEDFAFMLEAVPGSYFFVGNGDSSPLHSATYNFNDAIITPAAAYWVSLVEAFSKNHATGKH